MRGKMMNGVLLLIVKERVMKEVLEVTEVVSWVVIYARIETF